MLTITGCIAVSLAAISSVYVYKVCRSEATAQLKQDMLDRGMTAEEIKTVLEAGQK